MIFSLFYAFIIYSYLIVCIDIINILFVSLVKNSSSPQCHSILSSSPSFNQKNIHQVGENIRSEKNSLKNILLNSNDFHAFQQTRIRCLEKPIIHEKFTQIMKMLRRFVENDRIFNVKTSKFHMLLNQHAFVSTMSTTKLVTFRL